MARNDDGRHQAPRRRNEGGARQGELYAADSSLRSIVIRCVLIAATQSGHGARPEGGKRLNQASTYIHSAYGERQVFTALITSRFFFAPRLFYVPNYRNCRFHLSWCFQSQQQRRHHAVGELSVSLLKLSSCKSIVCACECIRGITSLSMSNGLLQQLFIEAPINIIARVNNCHFANRM